MPEYRCHLANKYEDIVQKIARGEGNRGGRPPTALLLCTENLDGDGR